MYIISDIHLFILLINIVPERNEKNFLSSIFVILFVAITFSSANSELNYTPFGVFGAFSSM